MVGIALVAAVGPRTSGSTLVHIGDKVPTEGLHIVTQPGRYGLGPPVPGCYYAVIGDLLVRVDAETGEVKSTIRKVTGILD